jgi:hypothetical protein
MRFKAFALSFVIAAGLLANAPHGGALAHGPAAPAHSYCGETTLASGMVTNSTPVSIIRNTCSNMVFARVVDPWWFSTANACIMVNVGAEICAIPLNLDPIWLPFGGTVESPAVPYQSGTLYTAEGFQNNHSLYINNYHSATAP